MRRELADPEKLASLIANSGLRPRNNKLSYIFDCPKCQKPEKLWMFKEGGRFLCWYCAETNGFKGRPEFALAALLNRPVGSIRKELYGSELTTADIFFDFDLADHWSEDEEVVQQPNLNKMTRVIWGPDFYPIDHSFSTKGMDYLAGRGISKELAMHYGLRYSPIDSRVAFPVGHQGALFGWQARYTGKTEWFDSKANKEIRIPKILSTDSLSGQRDRLVQFADQLTGTDQAIICEGPIDAIKCHLCQPKPDMQAGNIATMGKIVSDQQVSLLKFCGIKRVYLALDPDAEAEVSRLVKLFEPDVAVYLMKVPRPFKDFGEMSLEGVKQAYKVAKRINNGQLFFYLKPVEEALAMRPKIRH